ncbi:zinc transporter permease [Streptomyces sp. SID5789]|nr:zinc transporter permease [Streptomyces sp. SID5789]
MGSVTTSLQHQPHPGHEHVHGEGCGHVALPHGDHVDYVDYVHDGHRHAAHDGHWDDH